MNQELVDNINSGIYLEKANILLPWNTKYSDLKKLGDPNVRQEVGREYSIWDKENILNGLEVNLEVMFEPGLFGINRKLKWASAFIDEDTLLKTKVRFDNEFGEGKFKQSGNEYRHIWKLENATVVLAQRDRFGFYWQVEINHNSSWYGWWARK